MWNLSFPTGIESMHLQWKHGALTTGPPEKSLKIVFFKRLRVPDGIIWEIYWYGY